MRKRKKTGARRSKKWHRGGLPLTDRPFRSRRRRGWVDPDDAPELTADYFKRADVYRGDKLIRRGRPPSEYPKEAIKLRIDPDVLEHFRATGPGWQTRINAALRRVAGLKTRKAG
jgi:uncharacterized protein (DUF4415 family)